MSRPQISASDVRRTLSAARFKLTAPEAMRPVLSLMKGADPAKDVSAARLGLSLLWLADDVIAAVNRKLERGHVMPPTGAARRCASPLKGKSWSPKRSRSSSRHAASWSTSSASATAETFNASSTNCGFT